MTEKFENIYKYINTAMLTIVLAVLSALLAEVVHLRAEVKDIELNNAVIQQLVISHNNESDMWKDRIRDIENGISPATKDRWTADEALKSHQNLKDWVDRNYKRK